ncbi:MAG TPA: hypothetical protein VE911_12570 [Candidatus Nitrosopolaris sp.]|nr:hypothetical protein [Candidatus Nitrosopolaris sp.]
MVLTGTLGLITAHTEQTYLQKFPYFYDSAEYSFQNARLHRRLAEEGRLSLAVREWLGNERNPLRTAPLVLFAPQLLAHPVGHLATSLPALFAFVLLLGFTISRRSGSTTDALVAMGVVCTVPGFFDPTLGLATNWLDLPASLWIGAAWLCLLNSDGACEGRWLAAFAAFVSLATLSRYVAAAFALVAAGPVLAFHLARRWWRERHLRTAVFRPLIIVAGVVAVLAGPTLVVHLRSNAYYYSRLAYGMGGNSIDTAHALLRVLEGYLLDRSLAVRSLQCAALAVAVGIHLVAFWWDAERAWSCLLVSAWLAVGIPLFVVLVLATPADPSLALYVLPGVLGAMLMPITAGERAGRLRGGPALLLAVLAAVVGGRAAVASWRWASDPLQDWRYNREWVTPSLPDIGDQKAFDVALADALSRQGDGLVWSPFFDETSHLQTLEAFFRSGTLILPAGPRYFSIHEAYWRGFYPHLSPQEVSDRVYAATCQWVDLAVVLDDPGRTRTVVSRVNVHVGNPFTRFVARDIAQRVAADDRWRQVFTIDSRYYGRVAGYRNRTSLGRGYRSVLKSHGLFSSPIDP